MKLADRFVTVVAPLDDDGDIVEAFVAEVHDVLQKHYTNYEILLVDDASLDGTRAAVGRLLQKIPCLRSIRLSRRFGREVAISAGLDAAIGDFTVVMLPNEDPPALVPEFVRRAEQGDGVVSGFRTSRVRDESILYRLGARLFYWYCQRFLRMSLPTNATYLRVLTRKALNAVLQVKDQYLDFRTISAAVGYAGDEVQYVPINRRGRSRPTRLLDAVGTAMNIVVANTMQPLRLVSWAGLAISGVNALYALYILAIFLFKDHVAEGWVTTSLQLTVMFCALFLLLTVLSEYVGRILNEGRTRPLYHVQDEQHSALQIADSTRRNVVADSAKAEHSVADRPGAGGSP